MPGKLMKILVPMMAVVLLLAMACSSEEPAAAPASESAAQTAAQAAAQPQAQSAAQPAAQAAAGASSAPSAAPAAAGQPQQGASSQTTVVSPAVQPQMAEEKLQVVTTSNIIADWVRAVGQDRVEVFSLLPANADPHTFQPGARDIAHVADADLVMSVGLLLEAGWLTELVENAARDHESIVELGEEVDPIDFVELFEEHHDDHGDEHADEHADEHGHEEMTTLLGKLLIGDGETGAMSIIELDHDHVEQNAFDMGSRAGRIYATRSGRFAIAVASDANKVHIIDGGTYLEPHEGHFDLVNGEAELMGLNLSGDRPVHLAVGDEWAAVYYDGSGEVALIEEHELEHEGADYQPVVFNIGPQHGAAVPFEDDLFAITPQHPDYASNPEQYRLPTTVDIRDLSGNTLYSAGDCPSLHGDAGNGHMAVFGCEGGVLAVEADHGHFHHSFISAPAGEPGDFRLTTVWGASGSDHFLALGSAVGLYLVEPEEDEMVQLIDAVEGNSPIQAALSRDGEHAVVVMSSGEIRLYDLHDRDVIATNSDVLTTPVETGFWARPHIAMAPGAIFITDSVGGHVLQLDDHDLEEVDHWDVAGNPTKIAFVGIHGETEGHMEEGHDEHGHEEGHMEAGQDEHGHMEGDDHGHGHGEHDPHFWFDPMRVQRAVNSIAAYLSGVDPAGQTFYRDNAEAYNHELDELHAWIEGEVATLPHEQRLIVTNHDAYQYFAQRYDFEIVGAIIPSVSTEIEASARELAELVEAIEHSGTKAVFAEKQQSDRLARQIADETGAELVGTLYTGSLGEEGGEAGTYLDFMRYNVSTIVGALQ